MKLCVLSVAYPFAPVSRDAAGGAEQSLSLIDESLVRAGRRSLVVACEGSRTAGELITVPRTRGVIDDAERERIHHHHREAIRRALEQNPVDIVHLHGLDFHEYLPQSRAPALVTLHLPPAWYSDEIFRGETFRAPLPRIFLNCVSETQRRFCPPTDTPLPVIPNGVPVDRFNIGISKRNFVFSLGRICPEKGFHLALDAAALARTPMLLAGEVFRYPAHENYFHQEIEPRLDRQRRFLGPVGFERKRRLLAGARCLLAPSLAQETSSLVAMEALASGTPVIAFPSGALAEIVEDGVTGFLVNDEREMAEAIGASGSLDPNACRETARTRFSAALMIERYFELYKRLIADCA
ncbi:MAG: glycosyltransferase family 4 protein [Blastocatellales bacterium]